MMGLLLLQGRDEREPEPAVRPDQPPGESRDEPNGESAGAGEATGQRNQERTSFYSLG